MFDLLYLRVDLFLFLSLFLYIPPTKIIFRIGDLRYNLLQRIKLGYNLLSCTVLVLRCSGYSTVVIKEFFGGRGVGGIFNRPSRPPVYKMDKVLLFASVGLT